MGGRGRGRGRGGSHALSFNIEQLGLTPGEKVSELVVQPPPKYPVLEAVPAPLTRYPASIMRYRKDLMAAWAPIRETLQQQPVKKESAVQTLTIPWSRLPDELKPSTRKRKKSRTSLAGAKKQPPTNIHDLLAVLEKSERMEVKAEPEDDERGVKATRDKEGEERDEEEELEEDEDIDEEMDEGTDYNQNYFDNGENYLDEDDIDDDGPVF